MGMETKVRKKRGDKIAGAAHKGKPLGARKEGGVTQTRTQSNCREMW